MKTSENSKERAKDWGDSAITETDLHSFSEDMTYSGVTSFIRRPYRKDLEGIDVAILGVPFDTATTNRPGTRFGPRGIRAASSLLSYEKLVYGWDFHPITEMAIVDHGDLPFDFSKPAEVPAAIEAYAKKIIDAGPMLLTLGGDHFISYPLIKAHVERHGAPLSLIHFDAHSDTWEDEGEGGATSITERCSGMRRARDWWTPRPRSRSACGRSTSTPWGSTSSTRPGSTATAPTR